MVSDALLSAVMPTPVLSVIDEVVKSMELIVYGPPVRSGPVTIMPTARSVVEARPVIVALPAAVTPLFDSDTVETDEDKLIGNSSTRVLKKCPVPVALVGSKLLIAGPP